MAPFATQQDIGLAIDELDRRMRPLIGQLQGTKWAEVDPTQMLNGWAPNAVPVVWRVEARRLFMEGIITGGALGQPAFVLPYLPDPDAVSPGNFNFPVVANGAFGAVAVSALGGVIPFAGSNLVVDLSPVHYPIAT